MAMLKDRPGSDKNSAKPGKRPYAAPKLIEYQGLAKLTAKSSTLHDGGARHTCL